MSGIVTSAPIHFDPFNPYPNVSRLSNSPPAIHKNCRCPYQQMSLAECQSRPNNPYLRQIISTNIQNDL
jgi:hypothetical protein